MKKKISNKLALKICKEICKFHDIHCEFVDTSEFGGLAYISMNMIQIAKQKNPYNLIKITMHEVLHVLCSRAGVYSVYHSSYFYPPNLEGELLFWKRYVKTALKAERYVEKLAQRWFRSLFPGVKFVQAYRSKRDMRYFENRVIKPIRNNIISIEHNIQLKKKLKNNYGSEL